MWHLLYKKLRLHLGISLFLFYILASCSNPEEHPEPISDIVFDFNNGMQGWSGGISDYPADWDSERMEFVLEIAPLPEEVNQEGQSLKISGRNYSDDLLMFMKHQLSDLKPNHSYTVTFEVELASQYPSSSFGVGGSPGSSVYLKAGGSTIEPEPIVVNDMVQMNIDKGNQSQGGSQMKVLGDIGIPADDFVYTLINRNNFEEPVQISSDNNGKLWIIVGTDSGFESTTTLFFKKITVKLKE